MASGLTATRVLAALMISMTLPMVYPATAQAAPNYCTPQNPYPPFSVFGSVCTGHGISCYMSYSNCTPVPDVPGTWGPGGYTPKRG